MDPCFYRGNVLKVVQLNVEKRPLVFTLITHPFVFGHPYRLRALRRALTHIMERRDELWITTVGGVYDYCAGLEKGIVPGS